MSRIGKVWGTFIGQPSVAQKAPIDKDPQEKKQREQQQQHSEERHEERPADRQTVDKAMSEMRTADDFNQTGMRVEAFETPEGLRVRLTHASGATVKTMTAEEFLKLRENAFGPAGRGKILDQKF